MEFRIQSVRFGDWGLGNGLLGDLGFVGGNWGPGTGVGGACLQLVMNAWSIHAATRLARSGIRKVTLLIGSGTFSATGIYLQVPGCGVWVVGSGGQGLGLRAQSSELVPGCGVWVVGSGCQGVRA
jgi:hypothetical protein